MGNIVKKRLVADNYDWQQMRDTKDGSVHTAGWFSNLFGDGKNNKKNKDEINPSLEKRRMFNEIQSCQMELEGQLPYMQKEFDAMNNQIDFILGKAEQNNNYRNFIVHLNGRMNGFERVISDIRNKYDELSSLVNHQSVACKKYTRRLFCADNNEFLTNHLSMNPTSDNNEDTIDANASLQLNSMRDELNNIFKQMFKYIQSGSLYPKSEQQLNRNLDKYKEKVNSMSNLITQAQNILDDMPEFLHDNFYERCKDGCIKLH